MVWIESITSSAGGVVARPSSICRGPRSPRRAAPAPRRGRAGPRAAAPARPIPRPRHRRRRLPSLGQPRRDLQQQGRLADAGVAADQHRRSGDDPAADRAVELGDPARQPLGQRGRRCRARPARSPARRPADCAWRQRCSTPRRFPGPACSTRRSRRIAPASGAAPTRRPGTHIGISAWPSLAWSRHCGEARNGAAALGR